MIVLKQAIKDFDISYVELAKIIGRRDLTTVWRFLHGKSKNFNIKYCLKILKYMQNKLLIQQKILENINKKFYEMFDEPTDNKDNDNNA